MVQTWGPSNPVVETRMLRNTVVSTTAEDSCSMLTPLLILDADHLLPPFILQSVIRSKPSAVLLKKYPKIY